MENIKMNRTFHKSKNFKEAEEWDILQHIRMTPEQRQSAATKLRKKVYGIIGIWYCQQLGRIYMLSLMSFTPNTITIFSEYANSFVCH